MTTNTGDRATPILSPTPTRAGNCWLRPRVAKVRLLLDSFFDDAEALRSNQATAECPEAVAAAEGLDLVEATANPTGGIHAKWLLAPVDGVIWSAVGSLNGGEISHKVNREVVLMVDTRCSMIAFYKFSWALVAK